MYCYMTENNQERMKAIKASNVLPVRDEEGKWLLFPGFIALATAAVAAAALAAAALVSLAVALLVSGGKCKGST